MQYTIAVLRQVHANFDVQGGQLKRLVGGGLAAVGFGLSVASETA